MGTVSDIRIEGTQRIEKETVLSYLLLQKGDPWDPERVDKSLKALFATGLFADVKLDREGNTLVVRVVENPIINRIAFEGNSKLADKDLNGEIQLRARVVYTRTRVQNDVERILEAYRHHEHFAATVEPKVIQLSENRVDLVFEINEGASTGVRSMNFVGNKEFSDSTLRSVVDTKESRWYRFFSNADTYDPDRLTLLTASCCAILPVAGLCRFPRASSAVAEMTPDRDGFIVTFAVDVGERYKFGKIDVNIEAEEPDAGRRSLPLLTVQSGDWYDADAVEHSISVITDAVGNRGYAFVEVKPEIKRNREDHTIDIAFDVQEGPQVYVERIDITGSVRTLDRVIRRETAARRGRWPSTPNKDEAVEGAHQKPRLLQEGRGRQQARLGARTAPSSTSFRSRSSRPGGCRSASASRRATDPPERRCVDQRKNFLGRGDDVRIGSTLSFRSQQNRSERFTDPYFLDKPRAAGWDLFEVKTSPTTNFFSGIAPAYQQFSYGGSLRVGYQISENLRQTLKYTARSGRDPPTSKAMPRCSSRCSRGRI